MNGKFSLGTKLINSLFEGLIDILHLKVLLLDFTKVLSEAANRCIVVTNDTLVLLKLLNILVNNLVEVVFHDVDLEVQLANRLLKNQTFVFAVLVFFLIISYLILEGFSLLSQFCSFSVEFVSSVGQSLDDVGLLFGEGALNELLFSDDAIGTRNLRVGKSSLLFDISDDEPLTISNHEIALID